MGFVNEPSEDGELMLEYFQHMTSHLGGDCELEVRCCAALAIYAMYCTQICDPPTRIRMTPTTWADMRQLYKDARADEPGLSDVADAIRNLCAAKALVFAAVANHRKEDGPPKGDVLRLAWTAAADPDTIFRLADPVVPVDTGGNAEDEADDDDDDDDSDGLAVQYAKLKKQLLKQETAQTGGWGHGVFEMVKAPGHPKNLEAEAEKLKDGYIQDRTKRLRGTLRKGISSAKKKRRAGPRTDRTTPTTGTATASASGASASGSASAASNPAVCTGKGKQRGATVRTTPRTTPTPAARIFNPQAGSAPASMPSLAAGDHSSTCSSDDDDDDDDFAAQLSQGFNNRRPVDEDPFAI